MKRLLAVLSILAVSAACGSSSSTSPSSPSPSTPTFTATAVGNWPASRPDSSTVTGNGNALGVAPGGITAADGKDAGAVWIAIKATGSSIGQVRGTLLWDRALLSFDAYSEGEWFKQGGALVTWTLLVNTPGQVGFQLDRPSTLTGATGTGSVVYLRLRALARGTSPLQWSDPELRGPDFSARPLVGGSFGGTITVQ